MIEDIFSVVSYEEVVPAVVVVVADANALSPARVGDPSFRGNVGESAVAIVAKKMRDRFVAGGKAFQTRAVYDKNIQPAVVVVIVEGDATAGGFEQVFILVLSAEDGFDVQPGFAGDVYKIDAKIGGRRGGFL